jgi:hypothetical protein
MWARSSAGQRRALGGRRQAVFLVSAEFEDLALHSRFFPPGSKGAERVEAAGHASIGLLHFLNDVGALTRTKTNLIGAMRKNLCSQELFPAPPSTLGCSLVSVMDVHSME